MSKDHRPPPEIWLDDEALVAHFDALDEKDRAQTGVEAVPAAPLEQNELTQGLRRG